MTTTATAELNVDTLNKPTLLFKPCLAITFLLLVLLIMPALVSVVMLGLAVYAWRGPKEGLQALTLLFLVLNLNPGLFPFYGQGASLRWLVLFSVFGRLVWDGILANARWPFHLVSVLVLFSSVIACLALLSSRVPAISFFKIVAFCVGTVTVVTCFYRTRELQGYWFSWFFSFFMLILVLSLPLYLSSAGFYTNGRGFQGILIHPQTFGPVMVPIAAGLTASVLLGDNRSFMVVIGVLAGLFSIYASQSRTALLMYVLSLGAMLVLMVVRGQRPRARRRRPMLSPGVKLMAFISFCVLLVLSGVEMREAAQDFVLKQAANAESLSFQVRASMVGRQMENFQDHPLTGIGFGVPSSADDWVSLSTGFLGIPTGFPVEKGFLPSAVLEETGLIGASLLVVVLCCLLAGLLQRGGFSVAVVMIACLLANAGEMVFFSFGAAGLYYWLLIGLCYNSVIPCVE